MPTNLDSLDFLSPAQAKDELGRLGTYRVLKLLGRGGMGMVFLAEDPQLQRTVALKTMLPEVAKNPSSRKRFCARPAPRPRSSTITSSPFTRSARIAACRSLPCSCSRA